MDYILTIIERLNESILRNAKKHNASPANVAVLIYNKNPEVNKIEPAYGIMVNENVVDDKITFNQVLNITFDPLFALGGSKHIAVPHIIRFMQRKSTEHGILPIDIKLRITLNENYKEELLEFDVRLKRVKEYSYEWEAINKERDLVRPLRAFIYRNNERIKEMLIDEILQKA